MRLALAQINPTVGDLDANAALIARFTKLASEQQADLVLFPELALTGYPPRDLLLQEGFIAAASIVAKRLGEDHSKGITLVFGVPLPLGGTGEGSGGGRRLANSLLAYRDGRLVDYYDKRLLPTYDVFDENRYFFPGDRPVVIDVAGNDELIFVGSACVFGPDGSLLAAGPSFAEALTVVDITLGARGRPVADPLTSLATEEALFRALVLGVKDYCRKTGFKSAVLGLSGGIDSAVVAVLAAAALGAAAVHGVALPSRYSSEGSKTDAAELAGRLGVHFQTVQIEQGVAVLEATLAPAFTGKAPDVTEENLQSRLRGTILMALSNKFGNILLTTGNKSEMAVGYATLYGDMNGGLAVISDITKTLVYKLARWMNANWETLGIPGLKGPPIPEPSITKPPSAELRPNQTDQDSLPPYEVLDEIVDRYVGLRQSPRRIFDEMSAPGVKVTTDAATVKRVVRLIDVAEYKRKQAAIGLKVTSVAFGTGRRVPIAQGYRPERML